MRGYLADVGNGAPGWIQFHAAAPEEFTVLRETPGLHITGADSGKGVVYASGYTDDDRTEALFCLDPDTLEVQERINVGMPFADITYASGHDMIFFVYQTYFGFVPLTALTLGENTYPAGTALYFDLSDWVGDDYLTGVSDELYDNDFSWFTVITASGLGYSLTLSPTFQLMVMSGIDLEVEAFSEQGNSLIYSPFPGYWKCGVLLQRAKPNPAGNHPVCNYWRYECKDTDISPGFIWGRQGASHRYLCRLPG